MKTTLFAISLVSLALSFSFSACKKDNGPVATRTLNLNNFDEIHLQVDADVYITQGPVREVIVTGEENVLDRLDGSIRDNEWEIEFTRNVGDYQKLEIHITLPDIDKLRVSGSGNIIGINQFDVDDVDLEISGSGFIEVAVNADEVDSRISGSGDIRLTGTANHTDIDITGSGSVRSFGLVADRVEVNISGSGDAQVYAVDNLVVRISGSGNVGYRGTPATDIEITGSGTVSQVP